MTGPARACGWCRELLSATRADARFCSRRCRQAAYRLRRRRTTEAAEAQPMVFAYADPPYPGLAARYYRDQASFAGEVDHAALIASLKASCYGGWALSTGGYALRQLLPLCPPEAEVCPWVKPIGVSSRTLGRRNTWEPLIVVGGRRLRGGVRDWLRAHPARGGGDLPGRKPIAFCAWLFDLLGMLPGDELVDLFPGTGIVSRAWAEMSAAGVGYASSKYWGDPSSKYSGDPEPPGPDDVSPRGVGDPSARAMDDSSSSTPRGDGRGP